MIEKLPVGALEAERDVQQHFGLNKPPKLPELEVLVHLAARIAPASAVNAPRKALKAAAALWLHGAEFLGELSASAESGSLLDLWELVDAEHASELEGQQLLSMVAALPEERRYLVGTNEEDSKVLKWLHAKNNAAKPEQFKSYQRMIVALEKWWHASNGPEQALPDTLRLAEMREFVAFRRKGRSARKSAQRKKRPAK